MRRAAVLVAAVLVAAAALLAGCTGGGVSGGPASSAGSATAPPATVTAQPPTTPNAPPQPRATYQALVAQWQAARTAFVRLVTSGRRLTLAQEHAAAAAFLAAERRFVAAMDPARWPLAARSPIDRLRRASAQMQSHLAAMTRADSPSAFTERLADYSVDVARDQAAIRAVDQALGG